MQMEALPMTIAQIMTDKQCSPVSFNQGEETNIDNTALRVRPTRLRHHDVNQNSFDSGP